MIVYFKFTGSIMCLRYPENACIVIMQLHYANNCSPWKNTQLLKVLEKQQHPFNGPLSGTTWVSQYQKGKTNLDFTETRDNEWQWYQLDHMLVCTLLQIDNHANTPPLSFYRMPLLLPNQQNQSTEQLQLQLKVLKIFFVSTAVCTLFDERAEYHFK